MFFIINNRNNITIVRTSRVFLNIVKNLTKFHARSFTFVQDDKKGFPQ